MNVGLFDVNGDGLPDIVDAHQNPWHIYLNTGSNFIDGGTWYPGSSHDNVNNTANDGSVKRDFIDINCDGLPDVVDPGNGASGWQVWFNTGGGFTTNPQTWTVPNVDSINETRHLDNINSGEYQICKHDLFDIDGDGVVDFVVRSNSNTWTVYSNKSGQADLLSTVTDRLGGTVSITYNSSMKYQNTRLPFNYWVVTSITSNNGMSGPQAVSATTSYSDAQGLYDFPTKEFRGFGQVTETKPDATQAVHYFSQDIPQDQYQGLKGKEKETDVISPPNGNLPGALFAKTLNSWSSASSNGAFAPQLNERDEYTYDGTPNNPRIVINQYQNYDAYGNAGLELDFGNISTTVADTYNYSDFTYNTSLWIVDRVSHKKVSATSSGPSLRESWFYYDGSSSISSPPTVGNLTKEEHFLNAGKNAVTTYGYDSYGNRTNTTDPNGHATTIQYDGTFNTFPEKTTNAKGYVTTRSYDPANGNILQVTDPNNFITRYKYDVFGRKINEIKPYDSDQFPTTLISYSLSGTSPSSVTVSKRETPGQAGTYDTTQFVDGIGSLIQTKSEYWNSGSGAQIIADTFYDTMGRVQKQSNPYLSAGSQNYQTPDTTVKATTYGYDTLGRPVLTTNPDGTTVSRIFDHWTVTETDENGYAKSYLFDAYQRLTTVIENNSGQSYTTQYLRDPLGELTQITDNQGKITTLQYDALGRKTKMIDPDCRDLELRLRPCRESHFPDGCKGHNFNNWI